MSMRLCVLTCMPLDACARAMKIQMHKRLKRICSPSNSRRRKKADVLGNYLHQTATDVAKLDCSETRLEPQVD